MTLTPGGPVIVAGGGADLVGRAVVGETLARLRAGGAPRGSRALVVELVAPDRVA